MINRYDASLFLSQSQAPKGQKLLDPRTHFLLQYFWRVCGDDKVIGVANHVDLQPS